MRVAYDCHSLLTSPTGLARYTTSLAEALERRGVELRRFAVGWNGSAPPGVRHLRAPNPIVQRSWRLLGRPSIRRLTGDVDLVHGTEFVLPPLPGASGVVTIHDLSFKRDDAFPGARRLQGLVPWSLERAGRVLVPSEAAAAELRAEYPLDPERVVVTYEGVAERFFDAAPLGDDALAALGITRPFALVVGEVQPRKNLATLLEAWRGARAALPGWTLVVAGPSGWGPSLDPVPGAVLTGWVPEETLPGLMGAADLFCFPSLYEGFGLPPLEAMATGTAVLAGRYDAAPELLGDAAVLVDQRDPDALGAALEGLATDDAERARLAQLGRARAAGFTWDRTAELTLAAYEDALRAP
jgi:glycosyltransferase involved in cell wall biosynthesis